MRDMPHVLGVVAHPVVSTTGNNTAVIVMVLCSIANVAHAAKKVKI